MPQPTQQSVHIDAILTNISVAYMQQAANAGQNVYGAGLPYIQAVATLDPAQMAQSYMSPYIQSAVQSMSDIDRKSTRLNSSHRT